MFSPPPPPPSPPSLPLSLTLSPSLLPSLLPSLPPSLQELQSIWAHVLSLPTHQIGLNVPFSEYGGDSLLAIEVLSQASRKQLQVEREREREIERESE